MELSNCLFLTNKMSSDVLTQIVTNGINLLTEAGMEVHAVTFDGCAKSWHVQKN